MGAEAARQAGYKSDHRKLAQRLLRRPDIREAIEQAQAERAEQCGLSAAWVLSNLKEVAERCMQGTEVKDRFGNVIEGEWTFNARDANKALELIGKHLGMFIDRKQLDVAMDGPAPVYVVCWEGEDDTGRVAEFESGETGLALPAPDESS